MNHPHAEPWEGHPTLPHFGAILSPQCRFDMIDFFEYSTEMLCVADKRGYFTRLNQAWTKTLGWSIDELMSRPYLDFIHPDDLEATRSRGKPAVDRWARDGSV